VSTLRLALWPTLAFGLTGSLTGCPLAIVGGIAAAGGAGYEANQERGVQGSVNDFTIKTNIQNAWLKTDPNLPVKLNLTVYQGRVLLTGTTDNPQRKAEAAEIAKTIPGVRAVYNEIELAPGESVWHSAQDAWITSEVRSKLIFSNVRSVNYDIETVDKSVYLIGSARSEAELNHATDLARRVPGVRRVVSYVEVRPGAPPGAPQLAEPTPPPSFGNSPAAQPETPAAGPEAAPSPAPTTPVEVQKL
jgi:osmotically-inducible protein OsmY